MVSPGILLYRESTLIVDLGESKPNFDLNVDFVFKCLSIKLEYDKEDVHLAIMAGFHKIFQSEHGLVA